MYSPDLLRHEIFGPHALCTQVMGFHLFEIAAGASLAEWDIDVDLANQKVSKAVPNICSVTLLSEPFSHMASHGVESMTDIPTPGSLVKSVRSQPCLGCRWHTSVLYTSYQHSSSCCIPEAFYK